MSAGDPQQERAAMLEGWESAAEGWGKRAEQVRNFGMPVSTRMIDHLALQPGQRVLELAAGPGDTGFLAAELIQPGGRLICSDAADAMLEIARRRADALGIGNVEFKRIELEWIDLPTADVDAILCRWGLMLVLDPAAALQECRRVLRPGGRLALAVWDEATRNPWGTIPAQPLIEFGHLPRPEPGAIGPFALGQPGRLPSLLEAAGFSDVVVEEVELDRNYEALEPFLEETNDLSGTFRRAMADISESERERVRARIRELIAPYQETDGSVRLPGRSLVAAAQA
jgi:SAM-dependent methyltransferase